MNLKQISSVALLSIIVTLEFAIADDSNSSRKSLVGLQGVAVLVEGFDPEVERQGLTQTAIRTDAELRLRRSGIRVLTREESFGVAGQPYLYLNAIVTNGGVAWGTSQSTELVQVVRLERVPSISVSATTWSVQSGGGIVAPINIARRVRDNFNDMVDRFINAYLAANPKK